MDGSTTTLAAPSQDGQWRWGTWIVWGAATWFLLSAQPARATDVQIPWECTGYSGEAQTRCVQTFIEVQREKIAKLEGQLQAQQATVGQLKEQADRRAAAAADLQRQRADRPATIQQVPYAYPYAYGYPPSDSGSTSVALGFTDHPISIVQILEGLATSVPTLGIGVTVGKGDTRGRESYLPRGCRNKTRAQFVSTTSAMPLILPHPAISQYRA